MDNFVYFSHPNWVTYDPSQGDVVGYRVCIGDLSVEEGEDFIERSDAVYRARELVKSHQEVTIRFLYKN